MKNKNFIISLPFLIILSLLSILVKAETLCSYEGPDLSEDYLELTNFSIVGQTNPKVGDQLNVRFTLKNQGQFPIKFTDKGIFAGVRVRYYENQDFGFTFQNSILGMGKIVNFNNNVTINRNGSWKIFPSYEIWKGALRKQGPNLWHACELTVCPAYCENSIHYYNGYIEQNGTCGYLKETCEYGCNAERSDCANVSRIQIIEGPTYSVWANPWSDECAPLFNVVWRTNIGETGSIFYRKFGEITWTEVVVRAPYCTEDGCEYDLDHDYIQLEPNTTYYYHVKSCGPDDCVESPYEQFTTPSYLKIENVQVRPGRVNAIISWEFKCQYEEGRGRRLPANYTVYVVPTAYAHFAHPPWSEVSNSSFSRNHSVILSGMLEEGRNYTFYIKACNEYGYCAESERYTFETLEVIPFIHDLRIEPSHESVTITWFTPRPLNTTTYLIEKRNSHRPYTSWQKLANSSNIHDHLFTFSDLEPGTEYVFVIEHCTRVRCETTGEYDFNTTSCWDGIRNSGEYDVDCGGPCEVLCNPCSTPTLPSRFDWRNWKGKNWLTPVKDQAACGSCWAMSAIGAIETKYNIEQNDDALDIDLSEQYAVSDCGIGGSCYGGWPNSIFSYMKDNQGIVDEACFRYRSQGCMYWNSSANESICSPTCTHNSICAHPASCSSICSDSYKRRWKIIDFHEIRYYVMGVAQVNEVKRALLCHGPLSVCDCGHCVVLTGWNGGSWIFKNSWGLGWGNRGYGEAPIYGYNCSKWDSIYYVEGINRVI